MQSIILEETVEEVLGVKFIVFGGEKFRLDVIFPDGEQKWACCGNRCKATLYLVENREGPRKSHVVLTYKSRLSHKHYKKLEPKPGVVKPEPKKLKLGFSSLYPGLVSSKRPRVETATIAPAPKHPKPTPQPPKINNWLLSEPKYRPPFPYSVAYDSWFVGMYQLANRSIPQVDPGRSSPEPLDLSLNCR